MSRDAETSAAPGLAVDQRPPAEPPEEEEPVIAGTLFLTSLLLVMIFGFWVMMYVTLIQR